MKLRAGDRYAARLDAQLPSLIRRICAKSHWRCAESDIGDIQRAIRPERHPGRRRQSRDERYRRAIDDAHDAARSRRWTGVEPSVVCSTYMRPSLSNCTESTVVSPLTAVVTVPVGVIFSTLAEPFTTGNVLRLPTKKLP